MVLLQYNRYRVHSSNTSVQIWSWLRELNILMYGVPNNFISNTKTTKLYYEDFLLLFVLSTYIVTFCLYLWGWQTNDIYSLFRPLPPTPWSWQVLAFTGDDFPHISISMLHSGGSTFLLMFYSLKWARYGPASFT